MSLKSNPAQAVITLSNKYWRTQVKRNIVGSNDAQNTRVFVSWDFPPTTWFFKSLVTFGDMVESLSSEEWNIDPYI